MWRSGGAYNTTGSIVSMGKDWTLLDWLVFVGCAYVFFLFSFFSSFSLSFLRPRVSSLCLVFAQGMLRRVDPWDTWRRDLTILASFLLYGAWGAGVRFVECCKGFMFYVVGCWGIHGGWSSQGWIVGDGVWRCIDFVFGRWDILLFWRSFLYWYC